MTERVFQMPDNLKVEWDSLFVAFALDGDDFDDRAVLKVHDFSKSKPVDGAANLIRLNTRVDTHVSKSRTRALGFYTHIQKLGVVAELYRVRLDEYDNGERDTQIASPIAPYASIGKNHEQVYGQLAADLAKVNEAIVNGDIENLGAIGFQDL